MQEKNDYGMYSGGYIFDQMDRCALSYIRDKSGLSEETVLVTAAVDNLRFKRQLCDKYNITIHCDKYEKTELGNTFYYCYVEVLGNKGEIVAYAYFTFTEATNHCIITDVSKQEV